MAKTTGKRFFYFNTEAEAKAFVAGVEYVNESSIEDIRIEPRKSHGYRVSLIDTDVSDD